MASPRKHRRRRSMEEPVFMSADIINLEEELNRTQKDIFPECSKHLEKIRHLTNDFANDHGLGIYARRGGQIAGGIAIILSALALFFIEEEVFEIVAAAGAAAVVSLVCAAFGRNRKTHQKKNLKQSIEEESKGFQDKMNHFIDILEKNGQRTEEILRDALLSDHNVQALSEHLSYCFEKGQLFQEQDRSKAGDQMSKIVHLSENISEMISKINSVPDILKEIIKDNERQRAKPAKPRQEQMIKREFKEKAEKFINDMQKGICIIKNRVKDINQSIDSISDILS
ncbi:uncharacterized protein LOC113080388 [Carassius auratus]|uniref:Uncharacterized protein LOC113080388 n=1 Tax=Carassius auratus TaxID=7957 RepID=A0A6P6NHA1_CARAU|nr:uncharacterized protein LOC113080388 [Carassius auratus]XP_026108342.1 uncharacterized protein LOC113080388 [Carassius auratus]